MKKIFLLSTILFSVFNVYSQTQITLTFTARDSISHNPVSPDSVYVKNLEENCDTMLYGPAPVLSLNAGWPLGIGSGTTSSEQFILKQNYPNPFHGNTYLSIYRGYQGPLNLELYDLSGMKLAEYHNGFEKGAQSFVISCSGNKDLILVVSDDRNRRSIKIISAGQGNECSTIQYLEQNHNTEKSTLVNPDNPGFIFYLGNYLMYVAYATGYHDNTKFDAPTANTTYTFNMVALNTTVIPTVTTDTVSNITQTTATSGGDVTSEGGVAVTARGICWNTSPNPTTANNHTTDGKGSGTFVSSLTGLTTSTMYYVRAYATNSVGTAYGNEVSFATMTTWPCGTPLTIIHDPSGGVAPVYKVVTYGTVSNIPGVPTKCWITSNLGADHQANAVNDSTEASAGWYWQFNRKQGYKMTNQGVRTPNTIWITIINENMDWQPANDPCTLELGSGWRIPTNTEWTDVKTSGGWTNWNGPWNSDLKLHAAGQLINLDGLLDARGSWGFYRSNMQDASNGSWTLVFHVSQCYMGGYAKAGGQPLRCLND